MYRNIIVWWCVLSSEVLANTQLWWLNPPTYDRGDDCSLEQAGGLDMVMCAYKCTHTQKHIHTHICRILSHACTPHTATGCTGQDDYYYFAVWPEDLNVRTHSDTHTHTHTHTQYNKKKLHCFFISKWNAHTRTERAESSVSLSPPSSVDSFPLIPFFSLVLQLACFSLSLSLPLSLCPCLSVSLSLSVPQSLFFLILLFYFHHSLTFSLSVRLWTCSVGVLYNEIKELRDPHLTHTHTHAHTPLLSSLYWSKHIAHTHWRLRVHIVCVSGGHRQIHWCYKSLTAGRMETERKRRKRKLSSGSESLSSAPWFHREFEYKINRMPWFSHWSLCLMWEKT